jgi:hypothetical protein
MNDTAYFAWQGLKLDEAMRAHETKTGRQTSQIVCRKADLPDVAKQLRPEHVELRADSYVQRGTLYLAALVLVLAMLAGCVGGTSDYATYDRTTDAHTCPDGQTLGFDHSKGAATCVR